MIKDFKFFKKDDRINPTKLLNYHKLIIRYYYGSRFNLNPGQPNYNAGGLIFDQTNFFINNGHITNYGEVRSYYKESYRYLNNDVDLITDEDHEELVRMVEYEYSTRDL
jgi:hypothetical protein